MHSIDTVVNDFSYHRGKDVYQNLLNFAISTLKAEGYAQLGVDFTAYTHSVVRRIDERIMQLRLQPRLWVR